jgi:spermidine synthase
MQSLKALLALPGRIPAVGPARLALPAFTLTIGVSAFLLFAIQPMFTKMVIPRLGGTPAVWSVAMVFFQAVLLAGYAYAHLLTKKLGLRNAVLVHLALVAIVPALALPIAFDPSWGRPPDQGQALWLIAVFAASVGLPFFAISANGPLLQAWYATTGRPDADDPYFLYRASNLGSFLALLSYPFVVEPHLTLAAQSAIWSFGFIVLALGLAGCGWIAMTANVSPRGAAAPAAPASAGPAAVSSRLAWLGLGFVPSALLIAVTSHISTDVAAVPLLWIVPLALFLLSFVLAFSATGLRLTDKLLVAQPLLAALIAIGALVPGSWFLAAHLVFFFVSATICHAQLYALRPQASQLSGFYLFLSLGGVLGGAFASLLAPVLFNSVLEYPLLIVAALACRPGVVGALRSLGAKRIAAMVAAALVALVAIGWSGIGNALPLWLVLATMGALAAGMALSREAPARLLAIAALAFALIEVMQANRGIVERTRSFFAVHTVSAIDSGRVHLLVHGTTVHGAERMRDEAGRPLTSRPAPASYFHPGGVYEQAIFAVRAAQGGRLGRIAVIGLGMGSLACHGRDGESWEFFEIDPEVVRLARDTRYFRSLTACAPAAPIVLGDGRLTLAESKGPYDLIVLDAFSSDSVPVHLLTREALAMYADKLAPNGAIIFNISNRYMALEAVVAASASANGMTTLFAADSRAKAEFSQTLASSARVAVSARRPEDLGAIAKAGNWRHVAPDARTWTDDYSNILDPMLRMFAPR